MDADLSFIEISEADDSLLQQDNLNDDACNVYLSCSPLCSIRPKPSPRTSSKLGSEDAQKSVPASSKDSFNKENVNANKSDTIKLSLDPQQMKRKKKGGYNLRKSLAWDRAFFTEEGVLDPEELSMISGNLVCTGGEKLSIIHEEESESLSEVPEGHDSADFLALEEKVLKDLSAVSAKGIKAKTPLRTPLKRSGVIKNNVVQPSPTPKAKRRVLSAQDVNQSESKFSTGARPTTSSLTANVKASKVSNKETKARRLPFSKQEQTAISSTSKSSHPTGQLKRTQPPQPGISTQKNLGVKSSSNNPKAAGSTALVGLGGKSSTAKSNLPQAKRIVMNLTQFWSSQNGQNKEDNKTPSSTVKTHLEGVHGSTTMPTSRIQSERNDGFRTTGVSLPQKTLPVAGPRQNVQIPSAKPSGLRMPSPSMGFFGQQAKISATRNLSQRHTQLGHLPQPTSSNLRIPSSVKAMNDLRPPYSNPKMSAVVNDLANENSQLNLRQGSSGSSSTLSLRPDLHEKKNTDVELHSVQKLNLKIKQNQKSETSSAQQYLQSSLGGASKQHEESVQSCEIAKRLQIGDEEIKMKEKLHRLQINSCITPRDGDGMVSHDCLEAGDTNHEEVEKSNLKSHVTLALDRKESSKVRNIVDWRPMEVSLSLTSNNSSLSPQSKHPNIISGSGNCNVLLSLQQTETSEDFHECGLAKNSNVIPAPQNDTASEKRRSQELYGAEDKEHEENSSGMQNSRKKLKIVGDTENPFVDGNMTTESSIKSPRGSVLEGQFIKLNDGEGQTELPCCTAAEDTQDVEKSLEASGLLQAGNCSSGLSISDASCPEPNLQATSYDVVNSKVELCEEVECKDQLTGSATNSKSSSYKFTRDDFCAMEMNHRPILSHMFSSVELEDASSVDNLVEEALNGKHCTQYVENISSTMQPCDNALLSSNPDGEKPPVHARLNHYASEGDILPQGLSLGGSSKLDQRFNSSNMVVGSTGIITNEMEILQAPLLKLDVDSKGDDTTEDTEHGQKQSGTDCLPDVCRKSIMSSSLDKIELSLVADQDFVFDECHEDQSSFKLKSVLQPTEGMPIQDCSFRETLQEEMVNGCTNSEHVQPNLCMKAEANLQVEDITYALLSENKQIDMNNEVDVSAEVIWEETQGLQNVDHSWVSCSLDDNLCPSSRSPQRELSALQIGEGSKVESNTLPVDRVPPQQVTGDSSGENHKSGKNQDAAMLKPPLNATPFSDEWLAAIEAAGEEILTMKSGKVQNSPPDKTQPEPGPWSPVKKKHNQSIGPFDCTKCTNGNIIVPDSSSQ